MLHCLRDAIAVLRGRKIAYSLGPVIANCTFTTVTEAQAVNLLWPDQHGRQV